METLDKQFPTSSASYRIRIATPNDLSYILEVLCDNFHFEETVFNALCSRVKITQDERKTIETILNDTVKVAFNSSPCLVAIHNESNKIVGLNQTLLTKNQKSTGTLNKDNEENFFECHNTKSKLVDQYFKYLSKFNERAQFYFGCHDESKMEFYAIAVDKNHRQVGISGDLIKAGIVVAQHIRGVSLVFGVFTSYYSMRSAEKVGMHHVVEIDLLDYKSDEGEPIFANTKPHNIVYIMALRIENNPTENEIL